MREKNNLFDQLEKVKDGKLYAVNIHLKSGQTVHLEHLEKSEKDAYVNYVRTGIDKMLIETKKQVWRILPDDIERLEVKAYNVQQANSVYPLMRFVMARSRMQTSTFTRFITFFILLLIASIGIQAVRAMLEQGPLNVLVEPSLIKSYLQGAGALFFKGSMMLIAIMFALNILDLILKPTEQYYILGEGKAMLEGTKVLHIIITISCFIGFMIVNSLVFKLIEKMIG